MEKKVKSIADYISEYMNSHEKPHGGVLRFSLPDGRDVYNCSTPFVYDGKTYIWGRVEKRSKWATSVTFLFEKKDDGTFERVKDCESYPLEDPFFEQIGDEYILGGTHVVKDKKSIKTYYVYFYRGTGGSMRCRKGMYLRIFSTLFYSRAMRACAASRHWPGQKPHSARNFRAPGLVRSLGTASKKLRLFLCCA